MIKHPWQVMSGVMTLSVLNRRRPPELILGVDLTNRKAVTYYGEMVGSLRLHHKKTAKSRKQRAILYALNGDVYNGIVHLSDFVFGIFKRQQA